MKYLMNKSAELEKLTDDEKYEYFKKTYPNLCDDIIKYVLIRHMCATQIYEDFDFIDLKTSIVETLEISTEQVFNIEYAQFCDWRDESRKYFDAWQIEIENKWTCNGSWLGPILVTRVKSNYVAIDGNNRLRILRCFLKHSDNYKAPYHTIYYIHN